MQIINKIDFVPLKLGGSGGGLGLNFWVGVPNFIEVGVALNGLFIKAFLSFHSPKNNYSDEKKL